MRPFNYYEPATVSEAIKLLAGMEGQVRVMAGGTDLVLRMKRRQVNLDAVVCLRRISELRYIQEANDGLRIGALTTVAEMEDSTLLRQKCPSLARAAHLLGSRQVRSMATAGGNVCNAAPSADTVLPLLAMEAVAEVTGPLGKRELPLREFFTGPGQTVLQKGEILAGLTIPQAGGMAADVYLKHGRRPAMDIALVGVAAFVELADARLATVAKARLALGAVAPTPLRLPEVEAYLTGKALQGDVIHQAAWRAADTVRPITDVRATAGYRREMVAVMVRRALEEARDRAQC